MVEPSQIQDIASNQGAPRTTINSAFAIIRALLPSSAEKSALASPPGAAIEDADGTLADVARAVNEILDVLRARNVIAS